ncbi:hypothetical protein M3210_10400 [Oceanobacillus luteolus]|uniref:ABC transporter permease n=1 Tax=Oceanobacillus luteolus TaxID=1274358 RepID=A0ABW4HLE7_9BACI|nr:hypothetical protein [Oceanobacillus luteolus]MCM3740682.1 hypothetical protein [Oceanobacillus luteolus]
MNAWLALTKKELRLGLPIFIFVLILYAGVIALAYYIGYRLGLEEELIMGALGVVLLFHLFFLFLYLLYALNSERKRLHLWLHTPMPVTGLLLSKLAAGILFMSLTFIPIAIFTNNFFSDHYNFLTEQSTINLLGLSTFGIYTSAIRMALTFMFFWSIFLTCSQRMNDFLSFLITFASFLLFGYLYDQFVHLSFIQMLTDWGAISANDVITGFEFKFTMTEDYFEAGTMMDTSIFYIGHFIRDSIMAILMFFGACWIIDKKVEV